MTSDTHAADRAAERRTDGVTAKILQTVLAMRRGFGTAAAKNLLLRNGHADAFIAQALAIPVERRGRRRSDTAPALPIARNETLGDDGPATLDAAGMTVLHRLRFEADSGMHRMTIAECPAELKKFGLIRQEPDGTPTITDTGRQALKHFACVHALDSIARGLDAIPMSDDIRTWLETNLFLRRGVGGWEVTELGDSWLAFNSSLARPGSLS